MVYGLTHGTDICNRSSIVVVRRKGRLEPVLSEAERQLGSQVSRQEAHLSLRHVQNPPTAVAPHQLLRRPRPLHVARWQRHSAAPA